MLSLQTLADGLVLGGLFSLAAVGFSLLFGVLGVVNLSHGAFVLIGGYAAWSIWYFAGIDPLLALPIVMAGMFVLGYVFQRTIIQWATQRASLLASMLLTYGFALMIRNALVLIYSPDFKSITPSYAFDAITIGEITLGLTRVAALVVSVVLLGLLAALLQWSSLGRVIRATAQQEQAAALCGVNIRHVFAMTAGLSAAFAGAAGVAIGLVLPFSPPDETLWTVNAFVVVTLGGIGSPAGALVGGLILGIVNTTTAQLVGAAFPNAMMFLLLVLMLIARPAGLLGHSFRGSR
ncbi:MAG: branched-chain amino acid ABC transporter permease [Albidovulum sp.]